MAEIGDQAGSAQAPSLGAWHEPRSRPSGLLLRQKGVSLAECKVAERDREAKGDRVPIGEWVIPMRMKIGGRRIDFTRRMKVR
jgi:hypothetical protein